jgi:hypothetical protein
VATFVLWRVTQSRANRRIVTLTSADRVEVFRIDGGNLYRPASEFVGDYPVLSASSITQPQSKDKLVRFLQPYLQSQSYQPDATGCNPQPGLAFRIWQGDSYLEVVMCFSCNTLMILDHHIAQHDFTSAWHDFSEDRPFLVQLAKQAFPQDTTVKSLDEKEPTIYDLAEHDVH